MSTTYLASTALEELDKAQAVIDRHLTTCLVCGTSQPCVDRREAEAVFLRYERLPRRTAGLTTARPSSWPGFQWLPRS
jgi:hypothetical protein